MRTVFFDVRVSHEDASWLAREHGGRLPTRTDPIFHARDWYWLSDSADSKFFFFVANGKTGEVLADNAGFRAGVIVIIG